MSRKRLLLIAVVILMAGIAVAVNGIFRQMSQKAGRTTHDARRTTKYWTCSMHPSVRSERPGKCPICGMELIPVYKESQTGARREVADDRKKEEAYYGCGVKEEGHCPHCDEGKPDAKCICGGHSFAMKGQEMACPLCGKPLKKLTAGEVQALDKAVVSRVSLKKEQVALAGLVLEPVRKYALSKTIRTVGKVAFDPELVVAQEEYLTALETRDKVSKSPDESVIKRAEDIVEKSKLKLRLLGLSEAEIERLKESRSAQKSLILPEETAWVYADVYEYDIGWIKEGEPARITAVAYPGEEFRGTIRSIAPVLDPKTRSVKTRIEVANPEKKLKPEMYVDVVIEKMYISPDGSHEVIAVPKEAILDTGMRKMVYVQAGSGEYLGKEVKVGPEGVANVEGKDLRLYPILSGLSEGELIVRKGNFLIDSQSQLSGGMSVLWGGAQEIKPEAQATQGEPAPVETKHKH